MKAEIKSRAARRKAAFMSFGDNLRFLRTNREMTQEELAERMAVSRQTVSKWESDNAYPEMEKLIALCELFSCTMDALVRGDLTTETQENKLEEAPAVPQSEKTETARLYDAHMNRFSLAIAGAVGLILLAVGALIFLCALFEQNEIISGVIVAGFLLFLAIAIAIFIFAGIAHDTFLKNHPFMDHIYTDDEIARYDRLFPVLIAGAVATILIGVATLIVLCVIFSENALMCTGAVSIFFLFLTAAVPVLVWAGIQKDKYDIESYNREIEKERNPRHELGGKLCGTVMLLATIAFLLMGFLGNLWHPAWVVFPIGGCLCGVISIFFPDKN